MVTILDYYKYAALSTAAYVRMEDRPYSEFVARAQAQERLPLSIAQYLFDPSVTFYGNRSTWNIRYYYGGDNPATPDTTGFGVTLFEQDQEKVLAIRGVEPTEDNGVDLWQSAIGGIGILGMALPQAVSMVNHILCLASAATNTSVPQLHIQTSFDQISSHSVRARAVDGRTIYIDFNISFDGQGLEKIAPGERIRVTGHSLGGHLAVLAARLFPGLIDPEVFVYNAPGFDPATANIVPDALGLSVLDDLAASMGPVASLLDPSAQRLTDELVGLFRASLLFSAAPSFAGVNVISLESEDLAPGDDASIVASFLTGQQVIGDSILVPTEPNSHVVEPLTDALALHALLYRLSNGLTFADNEKLLMAAAAQLNRSEEALTQALFQLLLPNAKYLSGRADPNNSPVYEGEQLLTSDATGLLDNFLWIGKGDINARDAFHDALLRIQQKIDEYSSGALEIESLVQKSANELLLAASNPDPTSTSAIAYRYALAELNPFAVIGADYSAHNENGALNLYDEATRLGALTSRWIEDRAAMLYWNMVANTDDTNFVARPDAPNVQFEDIASNRKITVKEINSILPVTQVLPKISFGGRGADELNGTGTSDSLYGGAGADRLQGGAGNDYLEGGEGMDVYQYVLTRTFDDEEYVDVHDGTDTILDTDGRGVLRYVVRSSSTGDEVTIIADASVRLSGTTWESADGKFSYTKTLNDAGGTDLLVAFSGVVGGGLTLRNFRDGDFNIRLGGITSDAFRIRGDARDNNFMRFESGSGIADGTIDMRDNGAIWYYVPQTAGVILEGLGGADFMQGGMGADRLFAGTESDLATLGQLPATGQNGDYLEGMDGDDLLVGGGGNDLLSGGKGDDVVYGGPGADYINDDMAAGSWVVDWIITPGTNPFSPDIIGLSGIIAPDIGGGRDFLAGGAGNDWIFGGAGVDLLWGGEGDDIIGGGGDNDFIFGGAGADRIQADAPYPHQMDNSVEVGDDLVYGEEGDDQLYGLRGNDNLFGGEGDDVLYGDQAYADAGTPLLAEHGDDYLDGGEGNDALFGNGGNDTYVFGSGYGQDVAFDVDPTPGNSDVVRIIGVSPADVTLSRDLFNLYLSLNGGDDRLKLESWFLGPDFRIEEVRFDDGTVWNQSRLAQAPILGTAGADVIFGGAGNEVIQGLGGDDTLIGQAGDDTLDGGTGNDTLQGGAGSDTYIYGLGYGSDTIFETSSSANVDQVRFTPGLQPGDIRVTRDLDNLHLMIRGTADVLTIRNWYLNPAAQIESVTFADGTVWSAANLESQIGPSEEDDFLVGTSGPNVMDGLGGDDTLYGGLGGDTYVFDHGSGRDTILENDFTPGVMDVVQFKADVVPADVSLVRSEYDLHLYLDGGAARLTISNWFLGSEYRVEQFRFADGTVWSQATVAERLRASPGTQFDDYIEGTPGEDVLRGLGGHDLIDGNGGSDVLFGDDGNDEVRGSGRYSHLEGGAGNDVLFGSGNGDQGTVINAGEGDDSYSLVGPGYVIFGRNAGHDIVGGNNLAIVLEDGIAPAEVYLSRTGNGVYLNIASSDATLQLSPFALGALIQAAPHIWFGDGTQWDVHEVWRRSLAPYLLVGEGDDVVVAAPEGSSIFGLGGDDYLVGSYGDDLLFGGAGNDVIEAGSGNDVMRGGLGDDTLAGRLGNDTYLFGRGDGIDYIFEEVLFEEEGNELIRFDADVAPADVTLTRGGMENSTLVLTIADTGDTLNYFAYFEQFGRLVPSAMRTLRIEFADGTVLDDAAIYALAGAIASTGASDIMYGDRGDNLLLGLGGDDRLDGGDGNDVLDGGTGNDNLRGGAGDDVYVFGPGYGFDTVTDFGGDNAVRFTNGVSPGDVVLEQERTALRLRLAATGEYLIWPGALSGGTRIERAEFSDGTVWNLHRNPSGPILGTDGANTLIGTGYDDVIDGLAGDDYLDGQAGNDVLHGGGGADTLIGYEGDDVLDGGPGDDRLYGYGGVDTYVFDRGYGQDTVYQGNGRLLFGPGISPTDLTVRASGSYGELTLSVAGTTDEITLVDWFGEDYPGRLRVTAFGFSDGTVWDAAYVEDLATAASAGNDFLYGNSRQRILNGGTGDDYILALRGGSWPDVAPKGDFSLYGADGSDILIGANGDDWLEGGAGNDWLEGRNGSDTYYFDRGFGQDQIYDEVTLLGYDSAAIYGLYTSGFTDEEIAETYIGTANRVLFAAGISPEEIDVTAEPWSYDLRLTLAGTSDQITLINWLFPQQPTIQFVEFANGTVWNVAQLAARVFNATDQGDVVYGTSGDDARDALDGDDTLYGYAGNDILMGGAGEDVLEGGAGDDTLDGGAGNDWLFGGEGDDTYVFGRGGGQDRIVDFGPAPNSHDRILMSAGVAPQDLVLSGEGENAVFAIVGSQDKLTVRWFTDQRYRIEEVRFADGSSWDLATITAKLSGVSNSAPLLVQALDDVTALEDERFEWVVPENAFTDPDTGDSLSYSASLGGAPLPAWLSFDAQTRTFSGTPACADAGTVVLKVTATDGGGLSASDEFDLTVSLYPDTVLTGSEGNDTLVGHSGDDYLDGGTGADTMIGGRGDDTFVVDDAGDLVSENAGEGTDTVLSSITHALGPNVENLTLTGTSASSALGNELDNVLVGNSGILNVIDGQGGADTMIGGAGTDIYYVDNTGDTIVELPNEGFDQIISSIDYVLPANVEELKLSGTAAVSGTGNELDNLMLVSPGPLVDNILVGLGGNDLLDGGTGADTMIGGLGDDTYIVDSSGDVVIENAGEGTDTVQSTVTYTLGANLENLVLSGTLEVAGVGNGLDNALTGNGANNILLGKAGNDTLSGGPGDDLLDGGAGVDEMRGGAGNDTYYMIDDPAGDVVMENQNEGTDTVVSKFSYVLGANVENLTLTGGAAINATGNDLDNVLTGNSAANILTGLAGSDWLDGGGGADTAIGGAGNDTYVVDSAGDIVTEISNEGIDTVRSSITWTLGANVENLTLTETGAINATGNTLNNVLTGNSSDNVLIGGGGADTMIGGAGNDTYVVDSATDVITENANEGIDTVESAITWTIATTANVENIRLTGTSAVNATGNALANVLTGNNAVNTLIGAAGNDTLDGGAGGDKLLGGLGDDTYIVDNPKDVITENAGEGNDSVRSSITWILGSNLEALTLTGTSAINATGNTAANLLVGNSAINTISGGAGNDILQGLAGNDNLTDSAGANLLDGGAGNDTLTGNIGNELFIGRIGNDTFATGTGADLIAFNRGDGQDTVNASSGTDNTVSLGGNFHYTDLNFTRSSNNLVLNVGSVDKLTFVNWYSSSANRSVLTLQVIAEAMDDFNATSTDPLLNQKVQRFDFSGLAAAFDAAGQVSGWALTNALLDAHLAGSDTEAIGGDLAYQYGLNNTLPGIGLSAAQAVLNAPQFGTSPQQLHALEQLQQGQIRLV